MKFYAEYPDRLARQVLADLLVLVWLIGFGWLAGQAHQLVSGLRAPATGLAQAGATVADSFAEAARTASLVPFIGDPLATALLAGQSAGRSLAEVGQQQFDGVSALATGAALLVVLIGLVPPLALWLPVRLYYARAAGLAAASRDRPAGTDLLALRALTRAPLRRLHTVADDPADAWRRADPAAVRRLAELELRRLGLRATAEQPTPAGTGRGKWS